MALAKNRPRVFFFDPGAPLLKNSQILISAQKGSIANIIANSNNCGG